MKHKGDNTTGNSSKHTHTKAQNVNTDASTSQSANVATCGEFGNKYADDSLIDVLSNAKSEIIIPCIHSQNNKPFDLYDWLADTGTTSHITHRRNAFATYELILKVRVSGVGGVQSFVIVQGTVFLQVECNGMLHTLQLHNVLYIPENSNNLLLLGHWKQQSGRSIVIKYGKLELLTKDDIVIAQGICLTNNLYQISFQLLKAPVNVDFVFLACKDAISWEDWHKNFGHVSYSSLQQLLQKHLVDSFSVDLSSPQPNCVACMEVKITVSPYGPTTKCHTKVGELMHIDLWGKYDKASIHGNYYYLLLVDDASRYVTIEFLKTKTQAVQWIKDYMMHLSACSKITVCDPDRSWS